MATNEIMVEIQQYFISFCCSGFLAKKSKVSEQNNRNECTLKSNRADIKNAFVKIGVFLEANVSLKLWKY